jgi:hypothetical protein
MKSLIVITLGLLTAAAPLSAQDNTQSPPGGPGNGGPPWKQHGQKHGPPPGAKLTPEEQQRLQAAREKAKDDPTVRSLKEAKAALDDQLENAVNAAMLAADPSLAPILDKIKEARGRAKEMRGKFESLTPEQKEQLKAARMSAKDDPAVQAAREKLRDAQGPEAKQAAFKEMLTATKAAILRADPSLGPLLEQLGPGAFGPSHNHGPGQRGGHGGPQPPEMDDPGA